MNAVCYRTETDAGRIELTQQGADSFTVTYGRQVSAGLTYAAAALDLGAAIMHAAACAGDLDNYEGETA